MVGIGGTGPVTLSGLTITNGNTAGNGGGISNGGTLTVKDSTITGNTGSNGGGGIQNGFALTVLDSTISGNTTNGAGGGIGFDGINCYVYNIVGCTTIVTDSTISGNSSGSAGGAISAYAGTTIVTDSTLSGNSAPVGAGINNSYYFGGNITDVGGTILADGTPATECSGNVSTDLGYNIADDSSCGFTATGSVNSSATLDASLGALANYGGPTPTILPALTSPAVGVIPTGTTLNSVSVCPWTDQRGVASVGNCTIGAVEVPPPGGLTVPGAPTGVSGTPGDGQVALGWSVPASDGGSLVTDYAVSVFNGSGGPATGVSGPTTRFVGSATTSFAFTGLTGETAYTFEVAAVNSVGSGTLSALSAPVAPFTVPGAPTAVVGASGNGQVSLHWSAPADNGGSAITDYQVSVFDSGGGAATGVSGAANPRLVGSASTSYTFTGLTNATAYTFKVAAVNAAGVGAPSVLSVTDDGASFNVPAMIPNPGTAGFDSGYAVNNSVTVTATGQWCPDGTPADCVGPDGSVNAATPNSLLVGPSGQFALVGRIGTTGAWTLIGSGPVTLNGHGELYLAMNDVAGQFADNSGALQVSVAPLDGVTGATPPVSATLTSGYEAAWSVPIINDSGVPLTGVSATVHATRDGPVPLSFDTTGLMSECSASGNSDICNLPDVPAHSTYLFNVYVPTSVNTNNLGTGRTITGDVAVSASGGLNASGTLGTVAIVGCGSACVVAVAPPGQPVASSTPPTTPAAPPQRTVTLPATQAGATPEPIAVTLSTITPSPAESPADQKLCPTAAGQTHCSGKISSIVADFSKYDDAAHPIQVKVVTDWGSSVPSGKVLMEKKTGGDPLFLLSCQVNAAHKYNTPCLKSETTTGTTNKITTDTIFMTGLDVHFARRVSTGGTVIKPPAAPTAVTAVPGVASATLTWKAPTVTNGAGVTSYKVTVLAGTAVFKTVTFPSPLLTETVTGLTNGKSYTFKVAAGNVAGIGAASAVSAVDVAGVPGAPTGVRAVKTSSGHLQVTFTAPAATNGEPLTGYTATCTSSNLGVTKSASGAASPLIVSALSAGKKYTCTVKAKNSRGYGPSSVPSAPTSA